MRLRIFQLLFSTLLLIGAAFSSVHAAGYEVTDIAINAQAADAVKARDQAISQAQRKAFSVLVGKSDKDLEKITDAQIARLVSGFSVKSERLTSVSYSAIFTVRFEPNRTQSFVHANGLDLVTQELATMSGDNVATAQESVTPPVNTALVVLPILDIGKRQMIWDDPNPWREVWQRKDNSIKAMPVKVPLGDVTDIADMPDAKFLTGGGNVNIPNLLARYGASVMYIVVAKNQGAALDPSGGMVISLYRHDGKSLKFLKKIVLHPRPGYAFEDAVPAALNMIVMAENIKNDEEDMQTAEENDEETHIGDGAAYDADEQTAILGTNDAAPAPIIVTIPYQNLPQWVSIQRRLRGVRGVKNVIPIRVAPSSAEVQIITSESSEALSESFAAAGFELQALPNGEVALIDR